jgi:DNA invertase Pin-like site-specific DNA recombinase
MARIASYVRVSTGMQDPERQSEEIADRIDRLDIEVDEWDRYGPEERSGADDDRPEFRELVRGVEAGEYDVVVLAEVSRLARKSATAIEFLDSAVENDVPIHLTDDMIETIDPDDPMSQFMAKLLALFYEREREDIVRRVRSGMKKARNDGKWLGGVPAGFERDGDGYLQVDLDEYLAMMEAMERVEAGESYRSVAKDAPVSRPTLMDIHKDPQRRSWYLDGEAENEIVDDALDVVSHRHA